MKKFTVSTASCARPGGIVAALAVAAIACSAGPAAADDDRYAAIAVSTSSGVSGTAWNYDSPEAAESAAVDACNRQDPPVFHPSTGSSGPYTSGGDCGWMIEVGSGYCAAVVQSDQTDGYVGHVYSSGWGRTRREADFNAVQQGTGVRSQIIASVCQD